MLEKASHSSTLFWRIPGTEEPGRLQSMGSLQVGHDWATSLLFSLSHIGEGNGNPLQCSCLENPRDGGAWWAAVCGVTQSQTRLKRLSSSSSSSFPCKGTYDHLFIYPWTKALCLWVKFIDCGFIVTDGQDLESLIWGLPQIFVSVFLWVDQFL